MPVWHVDGREHADAVQLHAPINRRQGLGYDIIQPVITATFHPRCLSHDHRPSVPAIALLDQVAQRTDARIARLQRSVGAAFAILHLPKP